MMRITLIFSIIVVVFAISTYAQNSDQVWAWSPDGTCIELRAESTGNTQLISTSGGGMLQRGEIYRFVVDSQKVFRFAYQLELRKSSTPGAAFIRIKPLDPNIEVELSRIAARPGEHIPTVAGIREFPVVKIGEAVKVEILKNPITNETIYDVLRPLNEPNPNPGSPVISAAASVCADLAAGSSQTTLTERIDDFYLLARCYQRTGQVSDALFAYAKAEILGRQIAGNTTATKAREALERLYRAVHNYSVVGIEKVYRKAEESLSQSAK